ncbi:HvfC/BufC family peptide modification chaperone [Dokdonella immobilis]|uniref:Putative DNA-binding domain-containing protein n=1 Tax=Dokdonella immobilis TaxID=578942 RepID=A0A1I4ZG53_9GAMM|nr:putative DNA-binding domain-containing protein [Dokdonella immobilis]SFN49137.1 Putative DNA-binding domain-containing protein [Dokdonella immobilis]
MTALATLERRFLDHVLGGEAFPRTWCSQGLVDSDIGLSIYANAYHSRLREALEADHPVLSAYLGDTLWLKFCAGYTADHPSQVRSLRFFGSRVPDWLARNAPFSAHPVIAELAQFERALLDVFDAADAPRLDWAAMGPLDAQSWPTLRLRFHPSVRLLVLSTNAVEVWRALKDEEAPPAAAASNAAARLLWRDEERVTRFRPVVQAELAALAAVLIDEKDFSGLCERLACDHPADSVPAMAIGFLRQWFDEGVICALATDYSAAPQDHG